MTDEKDLRTIKDTNAFLRALVETPETVNDYFWLGGIVTYKYQSHLGHTYFTITDEQYSISCMLTNRYRDKSVYITKNTMIDVYGVIQVYEKEAKIQMMVSDVRPVELDESTLDFAVLEALETQGLFPREKQDLPNNPSHITLITSKNSEALRDFKHIYQEQKGKAQIELMDTLVQGEQAPKLIAQRIREANQNNVTNIIVITRGGGRHDDLATFNSFEIAEAICKSKIPIVTGIGHQRNETIADRVADQKTISPTDTAYKLAHLSNNQAQEVQNPKESTAQVTQSAGSSSTIIIVIAAVALLGIAMLLIFLLQG